MIKLNNNEVEEQLEKDHICPFLLLLLLQYIIIKLIKIIEKKKYQVCYHQKLKKEILTLFISPNKTVKVQKYYITKIKILKNSITNKKNKYLIFMDFNWCLFYISNVIY